MPDEIELPETPETPKRRKERAVGLIIAAIAVVLAIVTHVGNEIHQDELLAHIDATDEYNDYQTKKTTNIQLDLNTDIIDLNYDRLSPVGQQKADKKLADYGEQKKQNAEKGEKHKEQGDEHVKEATTLARKASILDIGEIALQISVVLCSITILTEQRLFMRMGVCMALAGVLIAAWALLLIR
ncbi:MAG TPA: DUF4337 domain-containing protein, partial [Terriglobales bacterium]|nr:DUF4337 domain-containing protein [Terriglobales bacterium]